MKGEMKKLKGSWKQKCNSCLEMSIRRVRSVFGLGCIIAIAFGFLNLGTSLNSWAAPQKILCDDQEVYSRIKCKQEGLVVQMEHMVDENLTKGATGLAITERQKELLRKSKAKARILHKKTRNDDFKSIAKGIAKRNKEEGCEWIPIDDYNANGICDWPEEECKALNFPDESCDPRAKKDNEKSGRYVCEEVCTAESSSAAFSPLAVAENEEASLEEVAQDLEDTYDALEDGLIETNETLEAFNDILENEILTVMQSSDDPCENIDPLPVGLEETVIALRVVATLAETVYNSSASMTRQTIVGVAAGFGGGGNTSAAGTVTAIAAGIANEAYIAVDEIVSAKQEELQENTFACLQQAVSDIGEVGGKVDAAAEQIEQVRAELSNKLDEVLLLLNTAQGLRPDFPSK